MTNLDYFKQKEEATISPMGLNKLMQQSPQDVQVVDVRVGPVTTKIRGALTIPLDQLHERMSELSKDKLIVVYCWETWCSLATKAAIQLLDSGFEVKEFFGGIKAWETMGFDSESTESDSASSVSSPKCDC